MLANIINGLDKAISFLRCVVQIYLFCTCMVTEVLLLAAVAYDCFLAISNPLLYMSTMSQNVYVELVSCCYLCGTVCSLIHVCLALKIPYYRSNVINHFFCDMLPHFLLVKRSLWINCGHVQWDHIQCDHPHLLFVHSHHHAEDALCRRNTQSLFCLCLPPHNHHCLSWNNHFHLLPAPLCQKQYGHRQSGHLVLHHSDSHAVPLIYSLRNKDMKEALRKVVNPKRFS